MKPSADLCHFNALANPHFIVSLLAPRCGMVFAPGEETNLDFRRFLEEGVNKHLSVLLACYQIDVIFHRQLPFFHSHHFLNRGVLCTCAHTMPYVQFAPSPLAGLKTTLYNR